MTAWCTKLQSGPICVPNTGVNDRHSRRLTEAGLWKERGAGTFFNHNSLTGTLSSQRNPTNPTLFPFPYIQNPWNVIFYLDAGAWEVLFSYTTFLDSIIINLEYLKDSEESLEDLEQGRHGSFSCSEWFLQVWSRAQMMANANDNLKWLSLRLRKFCVYMSIKILIPLVKSTFGPLEKAM